MIIMFGEAYVQVALYCVYDKAWLYMYFKTFGTVMISCHCFVGVSNFVHILANFIFLALFGDSNVYLKALKYKKVNMCSSLLIGWSSNAF